MSRIYLLIFLPFIVLMQLSCTPKAVKQTKSSDQAHNSLSEQEAQAGWQLLFDGNSLEGWRNYGKTGTVAGWEVKQGELIATGHGGDLITSARYDNFELSLDWKVSPEGNSGIFFHVREDTSLFGGVEHTGPEYQLIDDKGWPGPLEEWQKTGANYAMHLVSSRPANPVEEWNHSRIVVNGPHVEHWLNGVQIVAYELWTPTWDSLKLAGKWKDYPAYGMSQTGHISLQNHGNTIWFRDVKIRPTSTYIFNQKDLEGWKIYGTEKWYVEGGELICESGPDAAYGYLGTEKSYKDFELELEFKQEADGNSGVFFRSSIEGTKITGWQAEVAPLGHGTGGIYESYGRGWLKQISDDQQKHLIPGEWNRMKLRVVGGKVNTWLNGEPMVELEDEKIGQAEGAIALQIHDGGGIKVRWRYLRVREL